MLRSRLRRALPLIGLFLLAFAMSGCLSGFSGVAPGAGGGSNSGGSPDINAPGTTIPETDAGLGGHVSGELLVKTTSPDALAALASELGAEMDEVNYLESIGWARLTLTDFDGSLTDVMRQLDADPRVRGVQANHTEYVLPYLKTRRLETGLRTTDVNDPLYDAYQYGPQTIHAPAVWAQDVTGKDTWVSIIDTGIAPNHPDLAEKLLPGFNPDYAEAEMDPFETTDFHGHGTHVAGTAAALTNNGVGVAGVAPDAYIMPLRVFNPVDGGERASDFAIAVGILIAGNPSVIGLDDLPPAAAANLSLGGPVYSQAILDAVNYASDRGVVVVASMGNSYNQEVSYPAAYPRVLAVGATDAHDEVTDFSTKGPHNSIVAPGSDILSTVPAGYGFSSGTSMAAPHVTGAVALIREKYPGMAPHHVKELFEDTADGSGSFDRYYGYGRLNVARALHKADGFATKYGILEVYVHDGYGGDGFGGSGIYEADVVLWRGDDPIRTVRTGGSWDVPNMMFDGMAWFYDVEPGDDYHITVRLDPDNPWHAVDGEILVTKEDFRIKAGEVTSITVPISLTGAGVAQAQ